MPTSGLSEHVLYRDSFDSHRYIYLLLSTTSNIQPVTYFKSLKLSRLLSFTTFHVFNQASSDGALAWSGAPTESFDLI